MAEMLNVRDLATGERLTIPDAEPLESISLYKTISDKIWEQSGNTDFAEATVRTVISPLETQDAINEVVGNMGKRFVLSGINKSLKLTGPRREDKIKLSAEYLNVPYSAFIGTFKWDRRLDTRTVMVDKKWKTYEFTDGHLDFHRDLFAQLVFRDKNFCTILTWSAQRLQPYQDRLTSLSLNAWHDDFAESGYEGTYLVNKKLSVVQEIEFLKMIRTIGGLSVTQ